MAALQFSKGAGPFLALPGSGAFPDEPWRLFTYVLVHLNFGHFAWDAAAFLLLGTIVEMEGRPRYAALLIAAAFVPGLVFLATNPHSAGIQGSSGLDSALFAFIGAALLLKHEARPAARMTGALLLAAITAKAAFEFFTGATLFAPVAGTASPALFHAASILTGALFAIPFEWFRATPHKP